MIIIRFLLSPLVLFCLLIAAIGNTIVWAFDETYDHEAASKATKETTDWINSARFFPARRFNRPIHEPRNPR